MPLSYCNHRTVSLVCPRSYCVLCVSEGPGLGLLAFAGFGTPPLSPLSLEVGTRLERPLFSFTLLSLTADHDDPGLDELA